MNDYQSGITRQYPKQGEIGKLFHPQSLGNGSIHWVWCDPHHTLGQPHQFGAYFPPMLSQHGIFGQLEGGLNAEIKMTHSDLCKRSIEVFLWLE